MEKFSLYDLLGLLLPGVLFLHFLGILNSLFVETDLILPDSNLGLGAYICFSIIFGASLYSASFYLIQRIPIYSEILYKPTGTIYMHDYALRSQLDIKLNETSLAWFGKAIFVSLNEETASSKAEQDLLCKMREDFYDRMYYTLELSKNNEHPKTFQSFYFFFRQLVLACIIILLFSAVLYGLSRLNVLSLLKPEWESLSGFISLIILILATSILLARWYRKRMVEKMYWSFFIYLNQANNKINE